MHALPHRLVAALAAASVGVAVASLPLAAQAGRPTIGVIGGATFPTGDLGDGFDSGYHLGGMLGFRASTLPVGFRLEGTYHRMDAKGSLIANPRLRLISGTANIVAGPATAADAIRPYAIGGVGVYNSKVDTDVTADEASSTKFGLNGGAGIELPLSGIAVFAEARFHYVFSKEGTGGFNMSFIPLTVGLRF